MSQHPDEQFTFKEHVADAIGLPWSASEPEIMDKLREVIDLANAGIALYDASFEVSEGTIAAPADTWEALGWLLPGKVSEKNGEGEVIQ